MASLGSYLPSPGKVSWRRDAALGDVTEGNKVRHVMIKSAEVWERPSPHVMYKVEVLTEHDQWYLYRRYSEFHSLHRKLMKLHGVSRELLPPKRYHGNLSKNLIDQRRLQLENYLQKLIHSEARVSQSVELSLFLDVPAHDIIKVTDILTRHLYCHGDDLLVHATPIALSVNEMYSITKRLRLPFDAHGVDTSDPAADPAHLYSFLHQLQSLRISLPPPPTSICCMPFELSHFRSLITLKLDRVPLSQVSGLLSLQQQIRKLTVTRSVRAIRELLIEAVEEKRSGSGSPVLRSRTGSGVERWRVTAMAKLTENRVVVQPWHSLHTLVLSHNGITHLDDSLQVLPALRELNLSHNLIQTLEILYLCIPSLEKLNLSHNAINKILDGRKVLENVSSLNLSHNRLHSLDGITSFVSITSLNLNYNLVATRKDLNRLMQLRRLSTLCLQGNPISTAQTSRIFLLAKFLHKARDIQLDGQETTDKEHTRIHSYRDRYGIDPDNWPIMQSIITSPDSSTSSSGSAHSDNTDDMESHDCKTRVGARYETATHRPTMVGGQKSGSMQHAGMKSGSTQYAGMKSGSMQHAGMKTGSTQHAGMKTGSTQHAGMKTGSMQHVGMVIKGCCASGQTSSLEFSEVCDPRMEVSWQVHAPGDYRGSPISRLSGHSSRFATATTTTSSSLPPSSLPHQQGGRSLEGSIVSTDSFAQPLISPSFLTTQLHQGRNTFPDERNEERYAVGSLHSDVSLPTSRDEPDGQSEWSGITPPELLLVPGSTTSDPPSLSITTPPPTPLTSNGNHKPHVTPAMIRSALEALQQIKDKECPLSITSSHEATPAPIFSEAVTSALTAWISRQNSGMSANSTPFVSPPPSTPLESSTEVPCRPISASDLITALSSLIPTTTAPSSSGLLQSHDASRVLTNRDAVIGEEGKRGREIYWEDEGDVGDCSSKGRSLEGSNPCSVPATTPQEGLGEWYRLGIRPEEVIQALTALTFQEPQRVKSEEQCTATSMLSPITEEQPRGLGGIPGSKVATGKVWETRAREDGEGESGEGGGKGSYVELTRDVAKWESGEDERSGRGRSTDDKVEEGKGAGEVEGDVIEVTLGRKPTEGEGENSGKDEIDVDSGGWPSDFTDSENPVFSPESEISSPFESGQAPKPKLGELCLPLELDTSADCDHTSTCSTALPSAVSEQTSSATHLELENVSTDFSTLVGDSNDHLELEKCVVEQAGISNFHNDVEPEISAGKHSASESNGSDSNSQSEVQQPTVDVAVTQCKVEASDERQLSPELTQEVRGGEARRRRSGDCQSTEPDAELTGLAPDPQH